MKRRMRLIAGLALLLTVATGYATCYLHGIVLCFKGGDVVGTYAVYCNGVFTANETVYADEDSYRIDQYAVSRGGRNMTTATTYCDGFSTQGFPPNPASTGSFEVYYYSPCTGSDVATYNAPGMGYIQVYTVTEHYNASQAADCN